MNAQPKTSHIQIRVSPKQKAALRAFAKKAGMDMSEWVLTQLLPPAREKWRSLLNQFIERPEKRFVLAEINDLLASCGKDEFIEMTDDPPKLGLEPYWLNYLAALVECAAEAKQTVPPLWVNKVAPLQHPVFGTELLSLRLHLLTHSPPPFRRRNIFIDSSVGDRV